MTQALPEDGVVSDAEPRDDTKRVFGVPIHNGIAIGTVLLGVVLWEVAAQVAFARLELVFPSLGEIFEELYWLFASGEIYPHLAVTGQEVAMAFLIAATVGVIGGSILGTTEFLAEGVEPILYYFSSIPKIILYPLFIVALGTGIDSKIAVGTLSALFPITVNSIVGALNVRDDLIKVTRMHQGTRMDVFKHVYLPSMVTHIVNGLRLGVGVSIISVTLAELFVSKAGLGNRINLYFSNLMTSRMYATLVVLFVAALALNLSLLKVQDYLRGRGYGAESDSESVFGF